MKLAELTETHRWFTPCAANMKLYQYTINIQYLKWFPEYKAICLLSFYYNNLFRYWYVVNSADNLKKKSFGTCVKTLHILDTYKKKICHFCNNKKCWSPVRFYTHFQIFFKQKLVIVENFYVIMKFMMTNNLYGYLWLFYTSVINDCSTQTVMKAKPQCEFIFIESLHDSWPDDVERRLTFIRIYAFIVITQKTKQTKKNTFSMTLKSSGSIVLQFVLWSCFPNCIPCVNTKYGHCSKYKAGNVHGILSIKIWNVSCNIAGSLFNNPLQLDFLHNTYKMSHMILTIKRNTPIKWTA